MNKGEAIMKKKILVMAMTAAMLAAAGCGSGKSAEPVEISSKEDLADKSLPADSGVSAFLSAHEWYG